MESSFIEEVEVYRFLQTMLQNIQTAQYKNGMTCFVVQCGEIYSTPVLPTQMTPSV